MKQDHIKVKYMYKVNHRVNYNAIIISFTHHVQQLIYIYICTKQYLNVI